MNKLMLSKVSVRRARAAVLSMEEEIHALELLLAESDRQEDVSI